MALPIMANWNSDLSYFLRMTLSQIQRNRRCPYCGGDRTKLIRRKFFVTELLFCPRCGLRFRYPKEDPKWSWRFYQQDYHSGTTTEMPSDEELARLLAQNFSGAKDYSERISMLKAHEPGGDLLEFGASWGYGAYQLARAGYNVVAFEISLPRAAYAQDKLGLDVITEYKTLSNYQRQFDIVFTSHVMNHLINPAQVLDLFSILLRPGGLLFCLEVNGNEEREKLVGAREYDRLWNRLHPILINYPFMARALRCRGFTVRGTSSPYDVQNVAEIFNHPCDPTQMAGEELLIIARRVR